MKHYETLMLLPVTATTNEIVLIEKQLKTLVKTAGGNVGTFDKWGRYKLAYPIAKQEYGVYILARYEVAEVQTFFQKLETFLKVKCVESVMRYVHVNLTATQYAEPYIKPEAMEGAQPRDRRAGVASEGVVAVEAEESVEAVVETVVETVEASETVVEG